MHENHSNLGAPEGTEHGSIKSYILGFVLSLLFTFASYFLVDLHLLEGAGLVIAITIFALLQAVVQLVLFLHLGTESKPRWNLLVFLFMALVLAVIVFGSIWIMYNLNYRMM